VTKYRVVVELETDKTAHQVQSILLREISHDWSAVDVGVPEVLSARCSCSYWLMSGADVLLYTDSRKGPRDVKRSRVLTLAADSFTVESPTEQRFLILNCGIARPGGAWGSDRYAIPYDSVKAREVLKAAHAPLRTSRAIAAIDKWRARPTAENRGAAIAALQALDEESK
jgi:hypothetical protein